MKKLLPAIIGGAALIAAASFFGGVKFVEAKNKANPAAARTRSATVQAAGPQEFNGGMRGRGGMPGAANGGFVAGDVLSKTDASVTVKLRDGGTKIILLAPSTAVTKSVPGTAEDIAVGLQVTAMGDANQDGSVTAKNIQIR